MAGLAGQFAEKSMQRDEQIVEQELMEISSIQDDATRLERIVAWCAMYPTEIPIALQFFRMRLNARDDNREAAG